MTIEFIVQGKARAKSRPRFSRATGRVYTTKEDKIYEQMVRDAYRGSESFLDSNAPLRAEIEVYHQVPKSYSKKKRERCLAGLIYPTVKPDLDNIAKVILDSNNKILYKDDSQIVELSIVKRYAEADYVKVKIKEINENE
ncbi:MAG: RusA family crossover junction endodeoxyribonuclease [Clostridium sp.]|nr:RusA family crossover junction endodeoxyribonuclease [Clostridium sp.]